MNLAEIQEVSTSRARNAYGGKLSERQATHLHGLLSDTTSASQLQLLHWWRIDSPVERENMHFRLKRKDGSAPSDPELCPLYDGTLKIDITGTPTGLVEGVSDWGKFGRDLARALVQAGAESDESVQRCLSIRD